MGLINGLFGRPRVAVELGAAISDVAGAFVPNATRRMVLESQAYTAALGQYGQEFQGPHLGVFDRFMNGLNRLPRPALALGTISLFVYAMVAPVSFSERMQGLAYVPEPLWWLLGAVVSFYFGAREMSYHRGSKSAPLGMGAGTRARPDGNAALTEWQAQATLNVSEQAGGER